MNLIFLKVFFVVLVQNIVFLNFDFWSKFVQTNIKESLGTKIEITLTKNGERDSRDDYRRRK